MLYSFLQKSTHILYNIIIQKINVEGDVVIFCLNIQFRQYLFI